MAAKDVYVLRDSSTLNPVGVCAGMQSCQTMATKYGKPCFADAFAENCARKRDEMADEVGHLTATIRYLEQRRNALAAHCAGLDKLVADD